MNKAPWMLPVITLLIGLLGGFIIARISDNSDCWLESTMLGVVVYVLIVSLLGLVLKAFVLPVPFLYVIPGCAMGGLLRWWQLATYDTEAH